MKREDISKATTLDAQISELDNMLAKFSADQLYIEVRTGSSSIPFVGIQPGKDQDRNCSTMGQLFIDSLTSYYQAKKDKAIQDLEAL